MKKRSQKFDPKVLEEFLKNQNIPTDKIKQITELVNQAQNPQTTPPTPTNPANPSSPMMPQPTYPNQGSPGLNKGINAQMFWEPTPSRSKYDEPPALAEVADEEPNQFHGESYSIDDITDEFAQSLGRDIGIRWNEVAFTPEQFKKGLLVEIEHGSNDPETNVTNDCPKLTGKIAWAHLKERPDYYEKLAEIEGESNTDGHVPEEKNSPKNFHEEKPKEFEEEPDEDGISTVKVE